MWCALFRVWLLTWSLQGLTPAEEMLVSVVMPIMSIYRLPLGQYGYTGHIINLPQDIVTFAHSLPRLPSEVDVLIVRKDYQQGQMNSTIITLSLIRSLSCTHMTCQKLISNYTCHWHPHSLRSPKWRLRHPSYIKYGHPGVPIFTWFWGTRRDYRDPLLLATGGTGRRWRYGFSSQDVSNARWVSIKCQKQAGRA